MSLYYESFGDAAGAPPGAGAPPIVILHGLFGSGENWRTVARELANERRVLTPDLPGHGRSPRGSLQYKAMADTVAEFVEGQHGAEKAVVIGHSMGGKVAMVLAVRRPELVEKLVVVDIAPVEDPARHQEIITAQLEASDASDRKEAEATLAKYIDNTAVRAFLLKNFKRDGSGWRHDINGIAQAYQDILGFPRLDNDATGVPASGYKGPALFIRGERSDYVDDNGVAAARNLFPAAEFQSVGGAGHWVHAEKRSEFVALVREFVGR